MWIQRQCAPFHRMTNVRPLFVLPMAHALPGPVASTEDRFVLLTGDRYVIRQRAAGSPDACVAVTPRARLKLRTAPIVLARRSSFIRHLSVLADGNPE